MSNKKPQNDEVLTSKFLVQYSAVRKIFFKPNRYTAPVSSVCKISFTLQSPCEPSAEMENNTTGDNLSPWFSSILSLLSLGCNIPKSELALHRGSGCGVDSKKQNHLCTRESK